jgi:hypothetical protein
VKRLRVRWTLDVTFGADADELEDETVYVERTAAIGFALPTPVEDDWDDDE